MTTKDSVSIDQTEARLRHWLALLHAPGLGPATFHKLLDHTVEPSDLFSLPAGELRNLGLADTVLDYLRQPDWAAVDRDLEWASADNNHLLTLTDPRYPVLLRELSQPPPILFVTGQADLLSRLQLAVVGSRHPTRGGEQNALAFSRHLAAHDLVITSGLALGIDAAAHRGALDSGGKTLAVMGTGLDRVYPARHRQLAHDIAEQGALVSEFPPGMPPLAQHFPRRNRIISGLSLGVLVVEAALRSGSLITAQRALEQGRDVFAIPGSIHNPLARGCHALIRNGAKLVETSEHILEELGALALDNLTRTATDRELPSPQPSLDPEYRQLLEQMAFDPVSIDELVNRCGLTAEQLSSMLLLLELDGQVTSSHGGRYCRIQKESLA